ncbi:apolipoprotein N-acyltransferase [Falsirhodobacter xinxiangensis]|uniref:apolipoprotein N-acyltransferase n=1 Tax=Falsirhodobacter xinxiangensis TaxID=2530049 RepID=UPI0010AA1696|nr:apolipoprotein N-acyltransferase [Rhodobacter xinxiangensis]
MRSFPGWRVVGAAFALGAVAALGQAPLGWWPATIAGLAGLAWMLGRGGGWIGWFGGAGYFALALNWIIEPFLIDIARHGWMAPFAVVLISFGLALFWAVAAEAAVRLPRPALGFSVTLTLAEFARGHVLTGFPWAMPGHVWIGWAPAQVAALIGPNGLTLMTVLIAVLALTWRWAAVALLAAAFAFGFWRLDQAEPAPMDVTVRLVQPNADQHLKWDPQQAQIFFDRAMALTAEPGSPDLVIWPETSVPYLLDTESGLLPAIARAGQGATVAVGIQRVDGARGFNSLAVIAPDGRLVDTYDKHHLVPFGEYIPFGDTLARVGITAFASQLGNGYSAGPGARVLDLGAAGRALPLICYEAVFPQDVAAAPERPGWLMQVTNDAWFGTLTGPYQHLAQARLRAIEQGLPLLRAANTGVTAVIDAKGRVLDSLPMGEAGKLDTPLPAALAPTPYARWGEWAALVLILALVPLALGRRRVDPSAQVR